ncbi:MAG TPA: hypothetical protein VJN01_08655 [Xanthomonadales bacterium]|nr:hypothetical protein [Xanthomonadales bacterium]
MQNSHTRPPRRKSPKSNSHAGFAALQLLARILHSPFRKRRLAQFGKRHPINPR